MPATENRQLATRFFEEFCNQRKIEIANDLFTADYEYHDPANRAPVKGPQAMAETVKVYQSIEGHWNIEGMYAGEDDTVTVRWTGTGKFSSPMPGLPIPPNNNSIRVDAISVMRMANGKIAEHWCCWDLMGFMQQIGVIPTA